MHPIDLSIEQIEQTLNILRERQNELLNKSKKRKEYYHKHLDYDDNVELTFEEKEILEKTRMKFLQLLREQQLEMEKEMKK